MGRDPIAPAPGRIPPAAATAPTIALIRGTGPGRVPIPTINAPDLQKEAAKRKKT